MAARTSLMAVHALQSFPTLSAWRCLRCTLGASQRSVGSPRTPSTLRQQRPWNRTFSSHDALQHAGRLNPLTRSRSAVLRPPSSASQPFRWQVRQIRSSEELKAKGRTGPVSLASAGFLVCAGVGFYFYVQYEKARMERQRIAEHSKGAGRPKVGGPFELVDQNGNPWSSAEKMDGKFALVYFGFSHCPDICPDELDKMASMLDIVGEEIPPSSVNNPDLVPLFITCDPARDSPSVLKTYLAEFHPNIVGLTGTWEQIKAICRLYRVYFSTPPGVKPGQDYLVDHSIYFYLMDPEGDFVEAIGKQHTAQQAAKMITDHMRDWKGRIRKG